MVYSTMSKLEVERKCRLRPRESKCYRFLTFISLLTLFYRVSHEWILDSQAVARRSRKRISEEDKAQVALVHYRPFNYLERRRQGTNADALPDFTPWQSPGVRALANPSFAGGMEVEMETIREEP